MDTIEKRRAKADPFYKRYYKNNILLGTGTYRYRPYTVLTPTVALTFNLTGCSTTATRANRLGTTTISFTKSAGYNWPSAVQVTDATIVSWNNDTGVLVIEKPTLNTVTITITCVASIPKLDTPQNLSISGDTLTFDEVDHAEEYEVYANGTSIGTYGEYPVKGNLITLDGKLYRVLKINGAIAEVLAMYDSTAMQKFNDSAASNVYANSSLDLYMTSDFYQSLSTAVQNAIVEKTLRQDAWYYGSNPGAIKKYNGIAEELYTLSLMSTTYRPSISRKCYVLSCQDVIDYLEVTTVMAADTTLTEKNVWTMFWNQSTKPEGEDIWLRSASSDDATIGFTAVSFSGALADTPVDNSGSVRGAFQIDLSKVEWTKNS